MESLQERLDECWIVRAPAACVARVFIRELKYSLLLFDEVLMDATAAELTGFVRSLAHRKHTPVIISQKSADFLTLARKVARRF
jgi:hypothetical protein